MCHVTDGHHSTLCALPPHILAAISKNGTVKQRTAALATLVSDSTFRSIRAAAQVNAPGATRRRYLVTAIGQKQRNVSSAHDIQNLPGMVVRTENAPPTGDAAVDEAFDGLGATDDLYWEIFKRDSIDNDGMPLEATVHFGSCYNNAFWNGKRMVFGAGDGDLFNRFTVAVDVIGHEITHGVIEHEGGLHYFHESGALNESISDVFGSLVKQKKLNQKAKQADWLIGAGLFAEGVSGVAIRSMKSPGTAYDDPILGNDPQPAHIKNYVSTYEDNGGVHINSGIPNRAFYLTATQLGGYAWNEAGRIWYETLTDSKLAPHPTFQSFAQLTLEVADRIFGVSSKQRQAVADGWEQVGIELL
jgi:Zn-dependent metalloprotease